MKYYIIAGEASGDLHGSRLIRALKANDPDAAFRIWGGDLMSKEGGTLVKHYSELAYMGFFEVLMNISTIIRNIRFCKKDILRYCPDAVICIDYPGFNLPIADYAKKHGLHTIYYISPQVWAWKESRVKKIKKMVDRMLVILPFEKPFYQKWNYEVEYVGHPLLEVIDEFKKSHAGDAIKNAFSLKNKKIVALLPGSRKQEINSTLPVMLEATKQFKDIECIIAQAPGVEDDIIQQHTQSYKQIKVWKNNTYELLTIADAAMVASGTATLETALFGVPEVVCFKTSWLSFFMARLFIKVKYISLVNIIMNKQVIRELIQHQLKASNIAEELNQLLSNESTRNQMKKDFETLYQQLLPGGNASTNAAIKITNFLASKAIVSRTA